MLIYEMPARLVPVETRAKGRRTRTHFAHCPACNVFRYAPRPSKTYLHRLRQEQAQPLPPGMKNWGEALQQLATDAATFTACQQMLRHARKGAAYMQYGL